MDFSNRKTRKRLIFWGIVLALSLIRIPLDRVFISPRHLYPESSKLLIEHGRSVWYYKPICDSLLLVDSVRNLRFKVIESYCSKARYIDVGYLQCFLPCVKIINSEDSYCWNITLEGVNFEDMMGFPQSGIIFSPGDSTQNLDGCVMLEWDSRKTNTSHLSVIFGQTMPDTAYFTVWGYRDVYFGTEAHFALPDSVLSELGNRIDSLIVLGEIVFIKKDSIISQQKQEPVERKLIFQDLNY